LGGWYAKLALKNQRREKNDKGKGSRLVGTKWTGDKKVEVPSGSSDKGSIKRDSRRRSSIAKVNLGEKV